MTIDTVIAVNKPVGPTSHDIVDSIRRALVKIMTKTKRIKVGHAGTLDPLASGVLVIGIGTGTRLMNEIVEDEKEYFAEITLGATSITDDSEGPITPVAPLVPDEANSMLIMPTLLDVEAILPRFIGLIDQTPPAYSAIKTAGVPAYKRARAGETVAMTSRKVLIKQIEILSYTYPKITIRVVTGKGVYIRSLARDIGAALGTGAYMSALTRTRVGKWRIEESFTPSQAIAYLGGLVKMGLSSDPA